MLIKLRFLKVGQSPKSSTVSTSDNDSDDQNELNPGSWRQAIFKNVVTPNKQTKGRNNLKNILMYYCILNVFLETRKGKKKLDAADLRALWKKAINQQVLLIRMEKENAKLKGSIQIDCFVVYDLMVKLKNIGEKDDYLVKYLLHRTVIPLQNKKITNS